MSVLNRFEFHRDGIGILPQDGQGQRGSAIWVKLPGSDRPLRSCTCKDCKAAKKNKRESTCDSLKQLSQGVLEYQKHFADRDWQTIFESTTWFRIAKLIFGSSQIACSSIRVQQVERLEGKASSAIRVLDAKDNELVQFVDPGPGRVSFLERCGKAPAKGFIDRHGLLERLALFQVAEQERKINKLGMKTQRQTWEASFWYRLAYHMVREYSDGWTSGVQGTFHPAVDKSNGDFTFMYRMTEQPLVKVVMPRSKVPTALKLLRELFPEQQDLAIHPIPLRSIFRIQHYTDLDIQVRPVIRLMQQSGETSYLDRERLRKFRYGNLIYVKELGVLAELERDRKERKFTAPKSVKLERSQVPGFLQDHVDALEDGTLILDEPLQGLEVFKTYDRIEVSGEDTGQRLRYRLSVKYGFGEREVNLEELLAARAEGMPYFETEAGWIDLSAPAFRDLERFGKRASETEDGSVQLTAGELLRFQAAAERPLDIGGPKDRAEVLRRLLEQKPSVPYSQPKGFRSELRSYQAIGVDWLRFLTDHQLGGLLCDDMGLGKTHQAMALIACLSAAEGGGSFLVVCPTSVISHWRDKIRSFAPELTVEPYHGPNRRLARKVSKPRVVVTSYGIMRNDLDKLAWVPWKVVFFDEIQYLKNRGTLGYEAAARLEAPVKIGLTGTPIENSLGELKALFDLVLPGYLGADEIFHRRFDRALQTQGLGLRENRSRLDDLRRLISPFILRRLKSSVLSELPEKIEDLRTCELSPDQVTLYRQAIDGRGKKLVQQLQSEAARLPYIHIFALLNHLKQICDHPALAVGDLDRASEYTSGKWDLFCEILRECLDSGLKVVVFTQYLGMLELMARHLEAEKVDFVRLQGSTPAAKRGGLIDQFNTKVSCRVFLGSLKAGGTGIDLVGGSVVIHYDRWWNAAREDQATDRVHRLGQQRAVQVFKLVTEGTLEERIASIIEKKRDLLESVVQEDDAKLNKIFSRNQLLELLQQV